jgi:hypothetical protein
LIAFWLAFLSRPSLASAWTLPSTAHNLPLAQTVTDTLFDLNESHYWTFKLNAPAVVTVNFWHDIGEYSSGFAWTISLLDGTAHDLSGEELEQKLENPLLRMDSTSTDDGDTESLYLAAGTYYLRVHDNSGLADVAYFLLVTADHSVSETSNIEVTMRGAGTGAVNSTPPGLACTVGTCSALFLRGSSVRLNATPSWYSLFGWWNGACSGSGACYPNTGTDQQVEANFQPNLTVKLLGTQQTFPMIAQAYGAATSDSTICSREFTFHEKLEFTKPIAVTLDGGKDASFVNTIGDTTIRGSLAVSNGTLRVKRLIVR